MQNTVPPVRESSINADDAISALDHLETRLPTEDAFPGSEVALQRLDTIRPGTVVLIESQDGSHSEEYCVRQSTRNGTTQSIRLVRSPSTENAAGAELVAEEPNYYDVLQIGVKAEAETIYRVYRIMAARRA